MSREIKFRGLRVPDHLKKKNDGTWVYGYLYQSATNDMCIDEWKIDPATVGQFTGRTDKYGNEIYEGDIVANGAPGQQFEVAWNEELAGWDVRESAVDLADGNPERRYEIIGNIYENPEFLEAK